MPVRLPRLVRTVATADVYGEESRNASVSQASSDPRVKRVSIASITNWLSFIAVVSSRSGSVATASDSR